MSPSTPAPNARALDWAVPCARGMPWCAKNVAHWEGAAPGESWRARSSLTVGNTLSLGAQVDIAWLSLA
jgi:hypothetical protein